jgi:hypothetical protein
VRQPKWVMRPSKIAAAFVVAAMVTGLSAVPGGGAALAAGGDPGVAISGSLSGVAATSARNAWAVGYAGVAAHPRTLIIRWQGKSWKKVSAPGLGASGSLFAVVSTSARNAWAVGYAGVAAHPRTLIIRWQGKSWKKVSAPGLGASGSLAGVAATSARNAWAVGSSGSAHGSVGYGGKAVILHWNGSKWRSVRCPRPGTGSVLYAVAASSSSSAWAVGSYASRADPFGQPYIARWNGSAWKQVDFPLGLLSGVAATSARNAWAVGGTGGDGLDTPLILHWNARAWKQQHTPMPPSGGHLYGIAATSPVSAWAVGLTYGVSTKVFIVRWGGRAWKQMHTPRLPPGALYGIAATSAANAWAVGYTGQQSSPKTLILHWNGSTWK